jgi:hypothetical protein
MERSGIAQWFAAGTNEPAAYVGHVPLKTVHPAVIASGADASSLDAIQARPLNAVLVSIYPRH